MYDKDFKSAYKPYIIIKIYHVKYTNFVQSYTWPYFRFIVLLNLMFAMFVNIVHKFAIILNLCTKHGKLEI